MRDFIYQNKRNNHKYIVVRKYADGHYVWKQYIKNWTATESSSVTYTGCSLKRCHVGTWHRVSKVTMVEVLQDYKFVRTYNHVA